MAAVPVLNNFGSVRDSEFVNQTEPILLTGTFPSLTSIGINAFRAASGVSINASFPALQVRLRHRATAAVCTRHVLALVSAASAGLDGRVASLCSRCSQPCRSFGGKPSRVLWAAL